MFFSPMLCETWESENNLYEAERLFRDLTDDVRVRPAFLAVKF